jgi:hypothetical protein
MQSKGGSKMKGSGLGASLPLILLTIPLIFICHQLAKEKGKNVSLWTVLGIIPIVNYFVVLYLVGASNT